QTLLPRTVQNPYPTLYFIDINPLFFCYRNRASEMIAVLDKLEKYDVPKQTFHRLRRLLAVVV
ncbi:MAG TPA: hypothetical protein VIR31_06625, partial [Nitrososphaeraceae archaeon]